MSANQPLFSITVEVNTPAARVFEVMTDVERWHEWTPSVTSIKRLDAGPVAVGTRAVVRQPKFPPAIWTVSAIEPGRGFTWVNRAPGVFVSAQHIVEPTSDGSRATLSLCYEGWLGRLLARWTNGITNRYLAMEASGLKARAENPFFRHSVR